MSHDSAEGPVWDRKRTGRGKSTIGWLIAAIVVLIPIVAIVAALPVDLTPANRSGAGTMGYLVGYRGTQLLLVAGLVWLVLFLTVIRPSGRDVAIKYLLILVGVAILIGGPLTALRTLGVRHQGQMAKVVQIARNEHEESAAHGRAFDADFMALGLQNLLRPDAMASPGGVTAARAKLVAAHALVAKYHAQYVDARAALRDRFVHADLTEAERRELLAEFDRSSRETASTIDGYWALQEKTVGDLDARVGILARAKGYWRPVNGAFAFNRPADLAAFRDNSAALQQDKIDIESARDAINSKGENAMREINSLAP
jgi:hypothetical protein